MNRIRVDLAFRLAAGAVGVEISRAQPVQDRFRDDRARGIAGAEEQHVGGTVAHASSLSIAACGSAAGCAVARLCCTNERAYEFAVALLGNRVHIDSFAGEEFTR